MFDNLATNNNNQKQGQGASPLGQTNQGGGNVNPPTHEPKPQAFNPAPNPVNSRETVNVNNLQSPPVPSAPQRQVPNPSPASPIEDMFSETDSQEKPAIFQAKTVPASMSQEEELVPSQIDPYTGEQIKAKNKTIVFALMLISLMLVAMLGWYAYRMFFRSISPGVMTSSPAPIAEMIIDEVIPLQKPSVDLLVNDFDNSDRKQVRDSDNDGLSDNEEMDLGTNYLEADSDNDGLFDREEVKVYKTNPLDSDTDKDGYSDGMEVSGGYNPNGPGNLYDIAQ